LPGQLDFAQDGVRVLGRLAQWGRYRQLRMALGSSEQICRSLFGNISTISALAPRMHFSFLSSLRQADFILMNNGCAQTLKDFSPLHGEEVRGQKKTCVKGEERRRRRRPLVS
jgi:hypothetical protein